MQLINGMGTTCDDSNMWLVPFGATQEIRIDLKREQFIYGIRVWNYNKSLEDSFRGVKQMAVTIDGELISPRQTGFVLRKAPGTAHFDFDQIIRFGNGDLGDKRDHTYVEKVVYPIQNRVYKSPIVKQDYEPVLYPQGFVLKLVLWATWGDPYYVGLNGFELYDSHGRRISSKPSIVTAQPHSLADIDQQASPQDDVRVPDNLLSGKNKNTWDASDAWLAPLASSLGNQQGNVVYVAFDTPIVLSLIKFWNYSKTPERGAKDMDIYLDDLHIFSGTLRKAPHGNGGQHIGRFGPTQLVVEEFSQPVLLSTNQAQVDAEKRRVHYCGTEEQDVLCINEGQVVQESKAMYRKPDPGAEGVVVDLAQRPMTAMTRK
jgi:protein JBTS26